MKGKSKKKDGTKQTLEYVEQTPKFHVKPIKCRTSKQKDFLNCINTHDVSICVGPAGTSKTYTAVYAALKALEKKEVE